MVSEILYAVLMVAVAAGVCVAFAAGMEWVIKLAYRRFGFVRRFFDRIQFEDTEELEDETLSVHG